jgi:hypothetical protein
VYSTSSRSIRARSAESLASFQSVVGPDGQFGFIEDETGAPLIAQLADLLSKGSSDLSTRYGLGSARTPARRYVADQRRPPLTRVARGGVGRAASPARAPRLPTGQHRRMARVRDRHGVGAVYSPETLVTALEAVGGNRFPISSSTKPDLMVRMLEILDVQDGHRVLEIGTGTGYNAALLAHRLGDEQVFSVDVGEDLVDLARDRAVGVGSAARARRDDPGRPQARQQRRKPGVPPPRR